MKAALKFLFSDGLFDNGLARRSDGLTWKFLSLRYDKGRLPVPATLLLCAIAGVAVYFLYSAFHQKALPDLKFPAQYLPYAFAASAVVLLTLSFLYYSAYKFYEDSFYLFLSVGWLANFVYMFFDAFVPASIEDFDYSLKVAGLSISTTAPFYLAGFISEKDTVFYRKLLYETIFWVIWFSVTLTFVLAQIYDGGWQGWPQHQKFMMAILPTLPFFIVILVRIGWRLRSRLSAIPHGRWKTIFPWTFYTWALIQLAYPFKHFPGRVKDFVLSAFFVGLLLKLVNSIAIMVIIYRDASTEKRDRLNIQARFMKEMTQFDEAKQRLKERSALADIGLLTASIEHDIRNPLVVIGVELKRLKSALQASPEIVSKLEYIEEQKQRIFDATTVVPLLRASNAFFQQYMQKVTLNDLINASIKDVKREMNPTNIYFRVGKDQKEHKGVRLFYVTAYPPLLKQAVVNVLKNSIEAIREAKRESGVIDIDMREDAGLKGMIRVTIEDNGCGISEQDLPLVKSLFTTRDDRKPNSGIGLFISNRILEVHNGELEIASKKDTGTTVTVLIPKWVDAQHIT